MYFSIILPMYQKIYISGGGLPPQLLSFQKGHFYVDMNWEIGVYNLFWDMEPHRNFYNN